MKLSEFEKRAENIYLDYFNNYLTLDRMAEHYGLTHEEMSAIVGLGQAVHELKHNDWMGQDYEIS